MLNKDFVSTDSLIVKVPMAHTSLELVVEVVVQVLSNRKVLEVSLGYGKFDVPQLTKLSSGKSLAISLQGGNPRKNIKMQQ